MCAFLFMPLYNLASTWTKTKLVSKRSSAFCSTGFHMVILKTEDETLWSILELLPSPCRWVCSFRLWLCKFRIPARSLLKMVWPAQLGLTYALQHVLPIGWAQYFHIDKISCLFHSLAKHSIVHKFAQVFFKILYDLCSKTCVSLDVWFHPWKLLELQDFCELWLILIQVTGLSKDLDNGTHMIFYSWDWRPVSYSWTLSWQVHWLLLMWIHHVLVYNNFSGAGG